MGAMTIGMTLGDAHRHRNQSGAALAEAARGAMEAAGEQWTPMRAAVFAALASFDRPASAYDITDAVSAAEARRVAANSVYRILDLFVARNVAMRVESVNAYVLNAHPDCVHDCIFLVCDRCGRAAHVDDDALGVMLREQAETRGFVPAKSVIEMRGQCRACLASA
jgi:Fur family zinc uptake transcriptional regulator